MDTGLSFFALGPTNGSSGLGMTGMGAVGLLWIDLNYCCIVVKVLLLFHIVVLSFNSISYSCKLHVLETITK